MRYLVAALAVAPFVGVLIGMVTKSVEVKPCCTAEPLTPIEPDPLGQLGRN